MLKKLIILLVLATVVSGLSLAFAENLQITDADKDGLILYNLCYGDAKQMIMYGETQSDTIEILKDGNGMKFNYHEHVLSCGTHMNGVISEVKKGGKLVIAADFDVTHNPYKIQKLLVNVTNDLSAKKMTGTLTIDGKVFDVNLLR